MPDGAVIDYDALARQSGGGPAMPAGETEGLAEQVPGTEAPKQAIDYETIAKGLGGSLFMVKPGERVPDRPPGQPPGPEEWKWMGRKVLDMLPAAAAIGGAMVAPEGLLAATLGGALGGAAGETIREATLSATGAKGAPASLGQAATRVAAEGGIQGAVQLGGGLLQKTIGSILAHYFSPARMYQSAVMPSVVKGAEGAERVVETGLREGIPATEAGYQKAGLLWHDLNSQMEAIIRTNPNAIIDPRAVASRLDVLRSKWSETPEFLKAIDDAEEAFLKRYASQAKAGVGATSPLAPEPIMKTMKVSSGKGSATLIGPEDWDRVFPYGDYAEDIAKRLGVEPEDLVFIDSLENGGEKGAGERVLKESISTIRAHGSTPVLMVDSSTDLPKLRSWYLKTGLVRQVPTERGTLMENWMTDVMPSPATAASRGLTAATAQAAKKQLYEQVRMAAASRAYNPTATAPPGIDVQINQQLARGLKEELQRVWPELGALGEREGSVIELERALSRFVAREGNRRLTSFFGPMAVVMAGSLTGHPQAGIPVAAAWMLRNTLEDPTIKSTLAIALRTAQSRVGSTAASKIIGKTINIPNAVRILREAIAAPVPPTTSSQQQRVRAVNPTTGERIEYDEGRQTWVPAR